MRNKTIPCITHIFHEYKLNIDSKRKADIFDHPLATKCTLVQDGSKLLSVFESRILQSLLTIDFKSNSIE